MSRTLRALTGAAALAVLSMPALAEGWTTEDLGASGTLNECIVRAFEAFDTFGDREGHHSTSTSIWLVAAYDLSEDDFDGILTCTEDGGGEYRGTLTVYSVGNADAERRREIAATIKAIWNE